MTTRDFTANVISATKVVPDGNFKDSKASGIWDINEALDLIKGGNWPNAANINPSAFVDALFQTHLYTGNGGTQTITNDINLSGSGGLVWIKERDNAESHQLTDTERGNTKVLSSDGTAAEGTVTTRVTGFNSNGFSLGSNASVNQSSTGYVSWTFRKQPKFFDVVTFSATGSGSLTLSHNLGSAPAFIIVKSTSHTQSWYCYHHSLNGGTDPEDYFLKLDSNVAEAGPASSYWGGTAPTSTQFTVGTDLNISGRSYVAYLFAHNNDDGGFGEPGDQDIIKCGSYTGAGSSNAVAVDLGFEPQWVMIKNATQSEVYTSWVMGDTMRTNVAVGTDYHDGALFANRSYAEGKRGNGDSPDDYLNINTTSTGFSVPGISNYELNVSGETYIYMAIRRGGMQTPTAASDVFDVDINTQAINSSNAPPRTPFPVDAAIYRNRGGSSSWVLGSRLQGTNALFPNLTNAESDNYMTWDAMDGWNNSNSSWEASGDFLFYGLKRARGYFDVVSYTGTGSARTVSHNLGVAPEMMWIKNRGATENWVVYHSGIDSSTPEDYYLRLNQTSARIDVDGGAGNRFNRTAPTTSVFTVGTDGDVNGDGVAYISYHFATVANVSKVGSFTQSGATNVACGFTGDTPSFILLKRTDASGNWYLFDSTRGIVAGNDKSVYLDTTDAEVTNADVVDPYSGGFATTSSLTNGDYIFYAIAATS